jgi:hypothetical protein
MNVTILIASLTAQGVHLSQSGGKLRAEAHVDLLTHDLRLTLASRKAELLAVLAGDWPAAAAAFIDATATNDGRTDVQYRFDERAGIIEFDGNLPRPEAERLAYLELTEAIDRGGRFRELEQS